MPLSTTHARDYPSDSSAPPTSAATAATAAAATAATAYAATAATAAYAYAAADAAADALEITVAHVARLIEDASCELEYQRRHAAATKREE